MVVFLNFAPKERYLEPINWRCAQVAAAYAGISGSLEGVAAAFALETQKMREGRALIRYFSVPCKPSKANGNRERNLPEHAPEKWAQFIEYCKRDVETEVALHRELGLFCELPKSEWRLYEVDQSINDHGINLDTRFVNAALNMDAAARKDLIGEIEALTNCEVENVNSVTQLQQWLNNNGVNIPSLSKEAVENALVKLEQSDNRSIKRVLQLRQELSKSSVKKYQAMQDYVCRDGRARGLFKFYGAHTGRWSGKLIQVQNLPPTSLPSLEFARELVKNENYEDIQMFYDSVPKTLSKLLRTALVPGVPGGANKFVVVDFSAIEARVLAWLAGETWRNEVFATHGKIYEASASQMFKVDIKQITKDHPLRQKGKIAELALGYGGGVGALQAMGALKMGLQEAELQPLVDAWRTANPRIVELWRAVERTAAAAFSRNEYIRLSTPLPIRQSGTDRGVGQ